MADLAWPMAGRRVPGSLNWILASNGMEFTSPLTGSVQSSELPGARWKCSFTMKAVAGDDADAFRALLARLRGKANSVLLHAMDRPTPKGTIALAGVTLGAAASAGATSVQLAGCGAGATLKTGDYFGVAGELKLCVATATADGAGAMSVTFEPAARADWANGAAVTLARPTARFMATGLEAGWEVRAPLLSTFDFDLVERF